MEFNKQRTKIANLVSAIILASWAIIGVAAMIVASYMGSMPLSWFLVLAATVLLSVPLVRYFWRRYRTFK